MSAAALLVREYEGEPVFFQDDAYLNATVIAKRFGKNPKDYLKTERTKEYMLAIRKKILINENQLVIVHSGAPETGGGTWIHPKLAIDFARWLHADFAIWCDEQIEIILHDQSALSPLDQLDAIEGIITYLRQNESRIGGLEYGHDDHERRITAIESDQRFVSSEIRRLKVITGGKPRKPPSANQDSFDLDILPPSQPQQKSEFTDSYRKSPCEHERQGHWRQCQNGHRTWIKQTTVCAT